MAMPELEIDGERFDLDQTDAGRIAEELRGQELAGRIVAAMIAISPPIVIDANPEERQRLFDAVVAISSSGEATSLTLLLKILDALRAGGTGARGLEGDLD